MPVNLLLNCLVLLAVVFASLSLACRQLGGEVDMDKRLLAAGVFALLGALPLPSILALGNLLLPPLALYMLLQSVVEDRAMLRKLVGLTLLLTFVLLVLIYTLAASLQGL